MVMASATSPAVPPRTNSSRSNRQRRDVDGGGSGRGVRQTSESIISQRIAMAQAALWRAELSRSLLIPVVACLVALTVWAAVDQWVWSPGKWVRSLALLSGLGGSAVWAFKRVLPLMTRQIHPDYAAHSLENDLPELRHSLTSYVSLSQDHTREGVRGVVVRSIGVRAADQLQHHELEVPSEASVNLKWWLGVVGAIALALGFAALSPKNSLQSTKRLLLPLASIDAPSRVRISDMQPGDIEVLAGRPFEISANIVGLSKAEQARIEFSTGFASTKPLDLELGTQYVGEITVDSATSYRIVAGDATAGPFTITTKDVPVVSIDQVEVSPPVYTGLPVRSATGGAIVGEESSIAKIMAKTNRPISRARVEFNPRQIGDKFRATGGTLDMVITGDGMNLEATFPLRRSLRNSTNGSSVVALESYLLHVWDSSGAENLEPIVYPVRIVADLEPEVTITEPQKQLTEVPINGAERIEIQALDPDYGLKLVELKLSRGVDPLKTEVLWSSVEGERGNQTCVWIFEPKLLGLSVGQTVQVVAIASDNRHDENGELTSNVVTSDPISIKVIEPEANAKLPNFKPPAEQPEAQSKQDAPSEGGGQSGEKNQSGQGGSSSKDQPGKSKKGEGKSAGGSPGSGQSEKGEGQEQEASGSGASGENKASKEQPQKSAEKKPGNGSGAKPSESKPDPESTKQDASSEPMEGSVGDGSQETSQNQNQNQNQNAQQGSEGQPGKKPEHDGDAFERIGDFIDESKKKEQSSNDTDKESKPKAEDSADQPSDQPKPSASGDGASMKPASSKGDQGDSTGQDKAENSDKTGSGNVSQDATEKKSREPAGKGQSGKKPSDKGQPEKASDAASDAPSKGESDKGANEPAESTSEQPQPEQPQPEQPQPEQPQSDAKGNESQPNQASEKNQSGEKQGDAATGNNSDKPSDRASSTHDSAAKTESTKEKGSASEPTDGGAAENGKGSNEKEKGSAGKDTGKAGQPNPGAKDKQSGKAGDGKPSDSQKDGSPGKDSQSSKSSDPSSSGKPGGGAGDGEGVAIDSPAATQAPDAIDVEQARKATDLVLNYLNSQREKPDPELLERLDWTPEELRAFADRWNKIRRSDQTADGDGKQIEEALRSLGIRSVQNGQMGQATDTDDAVRGLKDGGNRTPAPSIHRDAFNAFRKNVRTER